jgi:uncharacterized protein YwgA
MLPRELVISVLDTAKNPIEGRTAIQKIVFFASLRTSIDMHYKAHYYGPYSPLVASLLENLVSLDYVEEREKVTNQDRLMYSYGLTADGLTLARTIKDGQQKDYLAVSNVVGDCERIAANDINILSWAAKVYFLLQNGGAEITYKQARAESSKFGWKLSNEEIDSGVKLLEGLHLVEASRSR